jgi:hypothetical protein
MTQVIYCMCNKNGPIAAFPSLEGALDYYTELLGLHTYEELGCLDEEEFIIKAERITNVYVTAIDLENSFA